MLSHFKREIQFVKYRNIFFAIAAALVVAAIVGLCARGLNLGIEFRGGTQVSFNDASGISLSDMRAAFAEQGASQATVQTTSSNGTEGFLVGTGETDPAAANALAASVASSLGLGSDSYTVTTIGPNWGSDVTRSMAVAFIVVVVLIVAFVSWRYEFKMSLMAVLSLVQVLLIIAGVYAWTQFEVTPNVIAALLTIMGFVLYDTVVVFNRVNENIRSQRDATHRTALQITNLAINQVIIRSINTTLTSLMPVLAMLIFGGETLKGFAFAMFIGLAFGAYSSISLAAPLYALWKGREPEWKRQEELHGEKAQARARKELAAQAAQTTAVTQFTQADPGSTDSSSGLSGVGADGYTTVDTGGSDAGGAAGGPGGTSAGSSGGDQGGSGSKPGSAHKAKRKNSGKVR